MLNPFSRHFGSGAFGVASRTASYIAKGIFVPFACLALQAAPVLAQDFYLSGGLGLNLQGDTSNQGVLYDSFTTGEVTGVSPPLTLPAGTSLDWSTRYDTGAFYGVALGWYLASVRVELEYSRTEADIDGHHGANANGTDLSAIDAGVLLSGNVGDVGTSTSAALADGRGDIATDTWMLNVFYDFDLEYGIVPYLGLGLGVSANDLNFQPSGVALLNDDDQVFSYQVFTGVNYALNPVWSVYANYRYRNADGAKVYATQLPVRFDMDIDNHLLDFGIRFSF